MPIINGRDEVDTSSVFHLLLGSMAVSRSRKSSLSTVFKRFVDLLNISDTTLIPLSTNYEPGNATQIILLISTMLTFSAIMNST